MKDPVNEVIKILEDKGAVLRGHFLLSSGRHSDTYVQCSKVLQYPELTGQLAEALAEEFRGRGVDFVISPAIGAIVIGYAVAEKLGIPFIFAEREAGKMTLRREFTVRQRGLLVEDVVTTGASIMEVINLVREGGGDVVGVASLVDRGKQKVFTEPLTSLARIEASSYSPAECPLCRRGIPIVKPGSRSSS